MSIDAAKVAALLSMPTDDTTSEPFRPLNTVAEVLAFLATVTRSEGGSEADQADQVELVIRATGFSPSEVRAAERILRRTGFRAVADRLAEIAGRRKTSLRPL